MAVKISEYEELVTVAEDDELEIVDTSASESKRVAVSSLVTANAAVAANTAHTDGDGSDHADVATNTAGVATNVTDIGTNVTDIGTNVTDIGTNTTHRGSSGVDHSNVVLNDTLRTTGWIAAGESWTSPSFADTNGESTLTITVPTDATTKYQAGMRVNFTQDATVRYGIITKVAATELTIFINTDYTPTANAITLPFYSLVKIPFGFDISPSKYSVIATDTTDRSQGSPTQNTWYNMGTQDITIPIGAWYVSYAVDADLIIAAGSAADKNLLIQTTLSKANNTEDDEEWTATFGQINSTSASVVFTSRVNSQRHKTIEITTADVYYLNTRTTENGITTLRNLNSTLEPSKIEAICAYL